MTDLIEAEKKLEERINALFAEASNLCGWRTYLVLEHKDGNQIVLVDLASKEDKAMLDKNQVWRILKKMKPECADDLVLLKRHFLERSIVNEDDALFLPTLPDFKDAVGARIEAVIKQAKNHLAPGSPFIDLLIEIIELQREIIEGHQALMMGVQRFMEQFSLDDEEDESLRATGDR